MASIVNDFAIDCAVDVVCPDGSLGAANADAINCTNANLAQVQSLILIHPTLGTPISNWTPGVTLQVSDFSIDNTDSTDTEQKQFFVKGGVSEPEESTTELNSFREYTLKKIYTLSFEFYNDGEGETDTYDYWRRVECGTVIPNFYYTTEGGQIFGRDGGIVPSKFSVSKVLEEGEDSVEKWVGTIQWNARVSPDRKVNPLPTA